MNLAREVHARWPNILLVIASGQSKPPRVEIPDDGRFIGKPYGAVELFGQVDDLVLLAGVEKVRRVASKP